MFKINKAISLFFLLALCLAFTAQAIAAQSVSSGSLSQLNAQGDVKKHIDNLLYLTDLFRELFNREPDVYELNYLVGAIDKGELTREQVRSNIVNSSEYKGAAKKPNTTANDASSSATNSNISQETKNPDSSSQSSSQSQGASQSTNEGGASQASQNQTPGNSNCAQASSDTSGQSASTTNVSGGSVSQSQSTGSSSSSSEPASGSSSISSLQNSLSSGAQSSSNGAQSSENATETTNSQSSSAPSGEISAGTQAASSAETEIKKLSDDKSACNTKMNKIANLALQYALEQRIKKGKTITPFMDQLVAIDRLSLDETFCCGQDTIAIFFSIKSKKKYSYYASNRFITIRCSRHSLTVKREIPFMPDWLAEDLAGKFEQKTTAEISASNMTAGDFFRELGKNAGEAVGGAVDSTVEAGKAIGNAAYNAVTTAAKAQWDFNKAVVGFGLNCGKAVVDAHVAAAKATFEAGKTVANAGIEAGKAVYNAGSAVVSKAGELLDNAVDFQLTQAENTVNVVQSGTNFVFDKLKSGLSFLKGE